MDIDDGHLRVFLSSSMAPTSAPASTNNLVVAAHGNLTTEFVWNSSTGVSESTARCSKERPLLKKTLFVNICWNKMPDLVQSWNVQSFPRIFLGIDIWSRKKYKKYPGNILGLTFAGSRLENGWDLVKTSHGVDNVRFGKVLGNKKS